MANWVDSHCQRMLPQSKRSQSIMSLIEAFTDADKNYEMRLGRLDIRKTACFQHKSSFGIMFSYDVSGAILSPPH